LGGSVAAAALTLVSVRGATARSERALAEQSAVAIASYLSIAAPPSRGGPDYDLAQLLIQARALVALLERPQIEVYHATAPLVHAVAPPLRPDELERLRRQETTGWDGNAALAPLLDREGWDVVGAVRVPRQRLDVAWLEWGLPALLLVTVAVAVSRAFTVGRPAVLPWGLLAHTAVALAVGCVAYFAVWTAAKRATDRWLVETGALVQEATTHAPGSLDVADVAGLVRGGTLTAAELIPRDPTPRRHHGVASVVVRMGGGRWAELRTPAAEAATGVWVLCFIGLALLGPVAVWIAARAER
jgi:hypothetical protein